MFGLPANLDLGFLAGAQLLQVCVGENEVILNFDNDVSITIESTLGVRDDRGLIMFNDRPRSAAPKLVELLSHTVRRAYGQGKGTLTLEFSSGVTIDIHDGSEHYESYTIRHGTKTYVV